MPYHDSPMFSTALCFPDKDCQTRHWTSSHKKECKKMLIEAYEEAVQEANELSEHDQSPTDINYWYNLMEMHK